MKENKRNINITYENKNFETGYMRKTHVWDSESRSKTLKCYNVAIRPEIVKCVNVFATSQEEAREIAEKMMEENLIPLESFESTGDYELDMDFQDDLDETYNLDTLVETIEEEDEKMKRRWERD